jgi:hypothetical protein
MGLPSRYSTLQFIKRTLHLAKSHNHTPVRQLRFHRKASPLEGSQSSLLGAEQLANRVQLQMAGIG